MCINFNEAIWDKHQQKMILNHFVMTMKYFNFFNYSNYQMLPFIVNIYSLRIFIGNSFAIQCFGLETYRVDMMDLDHLVHELLKMISWISFRRFSRVVRFITEFLFTYSHLLDDMQGEFLTFTYILNVRSWGHHLFLKFFN